MSSNIFFHFVFYGSINKLNYKYENFKIHLLVKISKSKEANLLVKYRPKKNLHEILISFRNNLIELLIFNLAIFQEFELLH